MIDQTECWQLGSGRWMRDLPSGNWRLTTTPDGTVVSAKLPAQDVARMTGAMRDAADGQWFPPEFTYSPRTGTKLQVTVARFDSTWVPPYGATPLVDLEQPLACGLRQTRAPLAIATSGTGVDVARGADTTLPALPAGRFRFLVHRFDVALPVLMAIDLANDSLVVLLPESNSWIPLERLTGKALAAGLHNDRGWRMEVVEGFLSATLYFSTANGLAAVTPTLIGLAYGVEYFGDGPAVGGPVAWAHRIWLPVLDKSGVVKLVGKPRGTGKIEVLTTAAPAIRNGFDAPVFDPLHVIWPCEEGQLVVQLDEDENEEVDWIRWPDGLTPRLSSSCPYRSASGVFWQLCSQGQHGPLEYVQMGTPEPQRLAIDAPALTTGSISYKNLQRITGDPWAQPQHVVPGPSLEVVVPLIESERQGVVVGLKVDAPQGVLDLLEADGERRRAVLQLEGEDSPHAIELGAFIVARPWLASLFVYDGHLWLHHPELSEARGWKLEHQVDHTSLRAGRLLI